MTFSSTIQVLKVEKEERTSKRTGNKYDHFAARCIVLGDDGEVVTVGVITSRACTPEVREKVKPGTYRAVFSLQVSDFGENKGEIVATLTDLAPV
jgi:hypothetical protein